jgi:peptidoglycan-associated lipoprotein
MLAFRDSAKLAFVLAFVALAGCATKPVATPAAVTSTPARTMPAQSSILPGSEKDFTVNIGDTVHFDYNKYAITDEDRSILQRQAAWLQKYPGVRLSIEGHCDERGTREYNLALGARRAHAIKEYLVSLSVSPTRLDTISYGKERPICSESTEACWARNRRGVSVITSGSASS